jgi:hypothetical protein
MSASPAKAPTIDALLLVAPRDIERAALLTQTIAAHGLAVRHLTVIAADPERVRADIRGDLPTTIRPESEFRVSPFEATRGWRAIARRMLGRDARLQQVIKLAAVAESDADYVLLLDADVLVMRPVARHDLFDDHGRARVVRLTAMHHPRWYQGAARLLGVPMVPLEYGVTPTTLHVPSVRRLLERLARDGTDWRTALSRSRSWTEFALYFTCLEGDGALDHHHALIDYDDWFAPSVWRRWQWRDWPPAAEGESGARPPFAVVQSHLGIPARVVAERLGIGGRGQPR